jgi:hypothetical protein
MFFSSKIFGRFRCFPTKPSRSFGYYVQNLHGYASFIRRIYGLFDFNLNFAKKTAHFYTKPWVLRVFAGLAEFQYIYRYIYIGYAFFKNADLAGLCKSSWISVYICSYIYIYRVWIHPFFEDAGLARLEDRSEL